MRGWPVLENLTVMGKPRLEDLRGHGATAVVSVCKKGTDPEVLAASGVEYVYLPIPDGKRVPVDLFEEARAAVERLLDAGHHVVVHCLAGRNRSATVAALVVRSRCRVSGAAALAHVRARRPNAVANPVFEAYLRELPRPQYGQKGQMLPNTDSPTSPDLSTAKCCQILTHRPHPTSVRPNVAKY